VVEADPGSAGSTGRYEDLFRFKVPQLRRISELGPYFHDNTAATLEEVVDYFSSSSYNNSADGRRAPIYLDSSQKQDLLAFLRIL
jgi:cytochrome c peroxidase